MATFKDTNGKIWAPFYFNIWSHWVCTYVGDNCAWPFPNRYLTHFFVGQIVRHIVGLIQCDHIWRNFAHFGTILEP